jgi:hypothetical protein
LPLCFNQFIKIIYLITLRGGVMKQTLRHINHGLKTDN